MTSSTSSETSNSSRAQLSSSATATVFQGHAYLKAYRCYFGAGKKFHHLKTDGAAAFVMTRGRALRRLEFWGAGIHDIGAVEYSTIDSARQLWAQIEHLAAQHDGAHLAQLEAGSPLIQFAQQAGWQVEDAETCPVLQLPPTWNEYVSSLGRNMREQIKRYPKRLEKQFSVSYELAQTEAQVHSALTDLFVLHGKRWRARGQTGVLVMPRRQKFHRAVCSALLKRDQLRLWTLRCDGKAACVLLSYVYNGRYYFFIGGFEPEMMRWSVGTCLFARVFQHAIEEGAHEFDFLRGEEEYKYRFGAVNRDYKTISHFADTPRGWLLHRRGKLESEFMHRLHQKFSAANRDAKS